MRQPLIVKAQAHHLPDIAAIDRQSNPSPWSDAVLQRYFAKQAIDACLIDDQCWGFCVYDQVAGEAELLLVAVAAQHRRLGLGTLMINHMLQQLQNCRAERVFLEVRQSNIAAIQLYEGLGFNQVGVRPNYYPAEQGREDALLLCSELC